MKRFIPLVVRHKNILFLKSGFFYFIYKKVLIFIKKKCINKRPFEKRGVLKYEHFKIFNINNLYHTCKAALFVLKK